MKRTVSNSAVISAIFGLSLVGPLWADAASDQYAEDQYAVAAGHYANRRWDLAATEFATFSAQNPDHPWQDRATFYHGEALVQVRRFEAARVLFQKLLIDYPQSGFASRALFRSGETAYLSGQLDLAKADLERFNQPKSDDQLAPYVLLYLAEIALWQGQIAAAEKQFAHALQQFPEGPLRDDCRLGLARVWQAQGRRDDAHRALQRLVDDPNGRLVDQAMYELGRSHYQADRLPEARATWEQLSEMFPESHWQAKADLSRGWISYREKDYAAAAERFRAILGEDTAPDIRPDIRIEAQYRLALVRRAEKQWDEAARLLAEAATFVPGHSRLSAIHFYAGDSNLMAGKTAEATEQFDLALAIGIETPWADDAMFGRIRVATERREYALVDTLSGQFASQFPESPLRDEAGFLQASAFVMLGRFQEAALPLEDFLANNPENPQIANCRAELAICYAHLGQFDRAKTVYDDLLRHHAQHEVVPPTTRHLADVAFAAGNRAWSKKLFARIADRGGSGDAVADGLSGLAWSQLKSNDLPGSASTFERLMREYPDDPRAAETTLARGQIFERLDKPDPALAMYEIVIHKHSQSPQVAAALFGAARLHNRLQQDQQAQKLYERLTTEHPEFPDRDVVLYEWGWVLKEQGDLVQSEKKFQTLYDEFPKSKHWAEATYLLAERAADAKQYDQAQELLSQILGQSGDKQSTSKSGNDPVVPRGLYLQGRIALARESWEAVESPLSQLVREHPESTLRLPALYWIAEAKFRSGDFDVAGEQFKSLVVQTQGHQDTWLAMVPLRLAQILARDKQWDAVLEIALPVESHFPGFKQQYEVDYLIGRCRAALGELETAREAYLRVVRAGTDNKTKTTAMAQWMIGETYMHQKMYEQARREYLRTETLYAFPEWQARSLLQAGKCYELQGHWQRAAELYAELKKKYPNTESVEEASRRLRVSQQRAGNVR